MRGWGAPPRNRIGLDAGLPIETMSLLAASRLFDSRFSSVKNVTVSCSSPLNESSKFLAVLIFRGEVTIKIGCDWTFRPYSLGVAPVSAIASNSARSSSDASAMCRNHSIRSAEV